MILTLQNYAEYPETSVIFWTSTITNRTFSTKNLKKCLEFAEKSKISPLLVIFFLSELRRRDALNVLEHLGEIAGRLETADRLDFSDGER